MHKYLGPYDLSSPTTTPALNPDGVTNERSIQDPLLLENRDRKYDPNVYELRCIYNVQDADLDLRQFGLFLENDTLFIEFHYEDMIRSIGRKVMSGDVLEIPHLRDDALLDPRSTPINKFYVVLDAMRASEGYSPTWWPHIWRVKMQPMTDSQEFSDITSQPVLDQYGQVQTTGSGSTTLADAMSNIGTQLGLDNAVVDQAVANVPARYFDTRQYWIVKGSQQGGEYPWVFAGDGVPPNGAVLVGAGNSFPSPASDGDYWLRTDYDPHALFMYNASTGVWEVQELDWRRSDWSMAHRLLLEFINNDKVEKFPDGLTQPQKQPLSKAIRPRADF